MQTEIISIPCCTWLTKQILEINYKCTFLLTAIQMQKTLLSIKRWITRKSNFFPILGTVFKMHIILIHPSILFLLQKFYIRKLILCIMAYMILFTFTLLIRIVQNIACRLRMLASIKAIIFLCSMQLTDRYFNGCSLLTAYGREIMNPPLFLLHQRNSNCLRSGHCINSMQRHLFVQNLLPAGMM